MKKVLLITLIILSACKQKKSSEITSTALNNDSIAQIERIEKNLVPVHYLKGMDHKKSIPQVMKEDGIAGVSIAFFEKDTITWQKTYGYANLADSTKVTPKTVFNGASLSKPVTAMAALNLVERGVLSLNGDVNNYLKGWKVPENNFTKTEKVTLKRLLGHTAGFERYVQSSYFPNEALPTIDQMLSGEKPSIDPPVSMVSVPGQKQIYSNPGYSVIEKLIEDATGKEFNDVMRKLIFEPCHMNNSSFEQPIPKHLIRQIATGYTNDLEPYPYKLFPYKAAGGIWTTPTDLANFLVTVLEDHHASTNTILSKRMTDSVFAKTPTRLGFAKIYNQDSPDLLFEHWGSNSGFTCYLLGSLNNKQGVVIMTNSDNGMSLMSYIARAVAVAYDWDFLRPQVFESIDTNGVDIKKFTGQFKGGNELLEFQVVEGVLKFLEETGNSSKLVPVAENIFIQPNNNTLYEFLKNKDGEIRYVRMTKADGYNSDYLKQ